MAVIPGLCLLALAVTLPVAVAVPLSDLENENTPVESVFDEPFIGEYGNWFQGDIILPKKRNGVAKAASHWPYGVIPYVFDSSVSSRVRSIFQKAVIYFAENTCIRLVTRVNQKQYVKVQSNVDSCSSALGKVGPGQIINLGPGCWHFGVVLHEIMHTIGFYHEQAREDRDSYVTVHYENIQDGLRGQFDIAKGTVTYGTRYDLGSIMHYEAKAFSKNGKNTITPKSGNPSQIGQRERLSATDKAKINFMYGCTATGTGTGTSSSCVDKNSNCPSWASQNPSECVKNPNYMLVYCQKSCQACASGCTDKNSNCPGWASQTISECERNPNYMLAFCRKSCQVCGKRVGCYSKAPASITFTDSSLTPNRCKRACLVRNYAYAGLQSSTTCVCLKYLGSKTSDSLCDAKCSGNYSMKCGSLSGHYTEIYEA